MKILLIGKNGQVGFELQRYLPRLGEVVSVDKDELDLANPNSIRTSLQELRPQLIVNASAYTDVNKAEAEEGIAQAINAEGPAVLAEEAKKLGAALVHYSTDYVFDGTKRTPYLETDAPNPLNAYGRTKLAGEKAVASSGAAHLILRTSWVYSTRGTNFLLKILGAATQKERLEVVSDQVGAPTWSRIIAAGTVQILSSVGNLSCLGDSGGLYHLTAGGETSWYEFTRAILENCSDRAKRGPWFDEATSGRPVITTTVTPIKSDEYPTPARRPAYSVLSNQKVLEVFGVKLPHWRSQLRSFISNTAANGGEGPDPI